MHHLPRAISKSKKALLCLHKGPWLVPGHLSSTCCHGDSNTMGQVGSLLLGNEMLEVQDWLLRSKGAERMIRGRWESRETPWGGHKGTGEKQKTGPG